MQFERFVDAALIEKALNQALSLDPQVQAKLAPLEGKTISIALDIRARPWVMCICDGRFTVLDDATAQPCDVRLRGTLVGFLRLFKQVDGAQGGVNHALYIEGDLHSAQQFQRAMASLSPDFDYALRNRFGERLGGILSAGLSQLRSQGEKAKAEMDEQLRDFFSGTNSRCATREEVHTMQQRLNRLRLTLDRLDARVQRLEL